MPLNRRSRQRLLGLAIAVVVASGLFSASATTANARRPIHTDPQTSHGTTFSPAGTGCDFDFLLEWTRTYSLTLFWGDQGHQKGHFVESTTLTNLDTGYQLHDTITYNFHFRSFRSHDAGLSRWVGVLWHLRDSSGKIVAVHAGQIAYRSTLDDSTLVKATPNSVPFGEETLAFLCPALGGSPAS